jgi:hypothetical protein
MILLSTVNVRLPGGPATTRLIPEPTLRTPKVRRPGVGDAKHPLLPLDDYPGGVTMHDLQRVIEQHP